MKAPILDFIREYDSRRAFRGHTPGHKGKSPLPELEALYRYDITEIAGADSLYEADGVIAESERTTSAIYGSAATAFSAGGSTICIQAMLAVMRKEGRRAVAVRNVHRSFLNSAALLGLDVDWTVPEYSGGLLSGRIDLGDVERLLAKDESPAFVYATSPDYTGALADIPALAALCKKYGARLLVDNAHGAHLAFFPESLHPLDLGADLCCDSAHKTLPALTGAAYLHTSREEYAPLLKPAMSLFGGTSPSYPIMASLDLCNEYLATRARADVERALPKLKKLRADLAGKLLFAEGEPFHIAVRAAESGFGGLDFAEKLRAAGVECEYADDDLVIILASPSCSDEDYENVSRALGEAVSSCEKREPRLEKFSFALPKKATSVREAALAPSETIPVEEAAGRVCGAVSVPCPPAIPIAASGEIIDEQCVEIFKRYGIKTVNALKADGREALK